MLEDITDYDTSTEYQEHDNQPQDDKKHTYTYKLKIIQHPIRARMCGFGNKDRRPCTPPPILRLFVYDAHGNEIEPLNINSLFYTVFASLTSEDMLHNIDLVYNNIVKYDSQPDTNDEETQKQKKCPYSKSLVGTTVSRATILHDLEGKLGIFFIFHDLSIRKDGVFRLKFSFFDLESNNLLSSTQAQVKDFVYTESITVYTARTFPGMIESTPLAMHFFRQGLKIPVRK
ncbi:hypothetical protein BB561_002639 [Smittium simulii]|uniref:Velvet domain-containing protein n=1 Tax=Smittium simulii TaxID=133385 RepID=A0A2T9YPQ1_9FUNG|nr:hypothetical protein BB561_002639 [Smittium simulii]